MVSDPQVPASDAERQAALDRALDGGMSELPPNQVRGILGERGGVHLRKEEDYTPDLNAGISQEVDLPVVWMGIILAYVLFFPLAFVLLWRSRHISKRAKIITSSVFAVGVLAVAVMLVTG
jgi:hypothetical protein